MSSLRILAAALALMALSGCVSTIQGAYDEQARDECEQESAARRGACIDRVEQNSRSRN